MTMNHSETVLIVDHQQINATMCAYLMVCGWFYSRTKLVIPRRKITVSGSALPLWKRNGEQEQTTTIEYSPFIRNVLHRERCVGCEALHCYITMF